MEIKYLKNYSCRLFLLLAWISPAGAELAFAEDLGDSLHLASGEKHNTAVHPVRSIPLAALSKAGENPCGFDAQPKILGHCGELYLEAGRYSEAVRLFRLAVFKTQQAGETDETFAWLIRWQWRLGKALKGEYEQSNQPEKPKKLSNAILAYQQAVRYVAPEGEAFPWEDITCPSKETVFYEKMMFIPDGALFSIPPAALHDGEAFLVENYAIAVTPVTWPLNASSGTLKSGNTSVLIAGLTVETDMYPKLRYSAPEVEIISKWYPQADKLLDKKFNEKNLKNTLWKTDYDLLHIISHARFEIQAKSNFLAVYNNELKGGDIMDVIRPSGLRPPLQLLVLSACSTAEGDNGRAALGLSGMAIKMGAHSVLGTLWKANDYATYHVMRRFYHNYLNDFGLSKAKALQEAQKAFLKSAHYHPFFWSSVVLAGNWQ